jgi:hypothetical protein
VVTTDALPAGWTGKSWACARGVDASRGDALVFLDADTTPGPDLLARLADALRGADLVSVQPYHRTESPSEWLSGIFNVVALMGSGVRSLPRTPRLTATFGPCLAIRRADYERIGGHAAVCGEVVEDLALGRAAERVGMTTAGYEGGEHISFRMYPHGVRSLLDAWTKNIASGAQSTPPLRLALVVAWMSGLIEAGWWAWYGIVAVLVGGSLSVVHLVFFVLFALQVAVMLRTAGRFGAAALVYPYLTIVFLFVFARSLVWIARGSVRWKGREIPLRPVRARDA